MYTQQYVILKINNKHKIKVSAYYIFFTVCKYIVLVSIWTGKYHYTQETIGARQNTSYTVPSQKADLNPLNSGQYQISADLNPLNFGQLQVTKETWIHCTVDKSKSQRRPESTELWTSALEECCLHLPPPPLLSPRTRCIRHGPWTTLKHKFVMMWRSDVEPNCSLQRPVLLDGGCKRVMIFSEGYVAMEIEAVSQHGLKREVISHCLPLQSWHMHVHNDNSNSRCFYSATLPSDNNLACNSLHCCCLNWFRANTDSLLTTFVKIMCPEMKGTYTPAKVQL